MKFPSTPARDERGSTFPLVVGTIFVLILFLFAALAISAIARERVRQQATADMAALSGANVIAKSMETARVIDGTIWARNVTLDAMYLAATIATIGSAGAGAEAFAVPLRYQRATIKPVEALERTRAGVERAAVAYAVLNGSAMVKANGDNYIGAAIPFPLTPGESIISQRQKDLKKMISVYGGRIDRAKRELDETLMDFEKEKASLRREGLDEKGIKNGPGHKRLLKKVREESGRVGGLTTQRNRRRNELARLARNEPFAVGSDGVVAIVYHPSEEVPFSAALGTVSTGRNVAVAAATMVDGPVTETIGDEAIRRLFDGMPTGTSVAGGIDALTDAVNLLGSAARELPREYGALGHRFYTALDKLGLVPPPLNEVRPALTSVEEVAGENSNYKVIEGWQTIGVGLRAE